MNACFPAHVLQLRGTCNLNGTGYTILTCHAFVLLSAQPLKRLIVPIHLDVQ